MFIHPVYHLLLVKLDLIKTPEGYNNKPEGVAQSGFYHGLICDKIKLFLRDVGWFLETKLNK